MKRFTDMLAGLARRYPDLWKNIDRIRAGRGQDGIADWPEWCFIPDRLTSDFIAASRKSGNRNVRPEDAILLPALAAWRLSQAVFRFDAALYERLTAAAGQDVSETCTLELLHLPLWCCYVETPGAAWTGSPMDGFFVHLTSTGEGPELRLAPFPFPPRQQISLPLPIGDMSIREAIVASLQATAERNRQKLDMQAAQASPQWREYTAMMQKMLSLAIFLCGNAATFEDPAGKAVFSGNPQPKRTKQGMRMFPADRPRLWLVGSGSQARGC